MKKYLILTFVLMIGCGNSNAKDTMPRGSEGEIKELCIDGVIYLYVRKWREGYMSVKFGTDSKVVTCPSKSAARIKMLEAELRALK